MHHACTPHRSPAPLCRAAVSSPSPLLPFLLLVLAVVGCGRREADRGAEPLFTGMGDYHRAITTASAAAQRYFDQGMVFYWGFNHEEAIRSFAQAALLDPRCAMAYWGRALALGPHINNPAMDETASRLAVAAVTRASELAPACTPVERELIAALTHRYAADAAPADRGPLDRAYAGAMRTVRRAHPDDPDIGALFAESLMDLRPWDLWSDAGEPRPETPEIIATLDSVLARAPRHPGANHFYVHTLEASPEPERARAAAERLRDLVPGVGHLVHMPSHIDVRAGRYDDMIAANQRAIAADSAYTRQGGHGDFFTLYRAHNYHFLAYGAMFEGRRALALAAADDMIALMPLDLVRALPDFLDGFLAVRTHVMVRFGMWDEIIAAPAPPADLPVTTAFWRFGRAVAHSALGHVDEGAAELTALGAAYERVPESALIGNNPARVVLDVALPFAEGELAYRRRNYERAFALLREAVRRDDALRYDEPWGWMEPTRHALGALLLEQGRVAEAEEVYREDLRLHPENGWALHGLAECLRRAGRADEAAAVDRRFRAAWSQSDIVIQASCYCRRGV